MSKNNSSVILKKVSRQNINSKVENNNQIIKKMFYNLNLQVIIFII